MERNRHRELEAQVSAQKEQLNRYEKRLKDVVTAYKGLLKEKEALETSLAAISLTKESTEGNKKLNQENEPEEKTSNAADPGLQDSLEESKTNNDKSQLQSQILTLMNSLATLSAEKSRMEASFQGDKKQLRMQITEKEHTISELNAKLKTNTQKAKIDVDEVRAKWICERQEREKETNNQMLMIRELQKLYADERHLKENIEMQLNNFKTQLVSKEVEDPRLNELQVQLKETKAQLKQLQVEGKDASTISASQNAAELLKQVQQEMHQMKEQHAAAIKSEQRRVSLAEEQSRMQAALHETRVASLESKLAELSSTVGAYDRIQQQDQENIQSLRKKLQDYQLNRKSLEVTLDSKKPHSISKEQDVPSIINEISRLKHMLMIENSRLETPIDLNKVFSIHGDHFPCQLKIQSLENDKHAAKKELTQLQSKLRTQRTHLSTLQEKVTVLNQNIDEQEQELKQHNEKLRKAIKEERHKWRTAITELKNEHRCRVNDLEQQLQKQRQRSLQLLDEKEQEMKALQTSFDVFQNVAQSSEQAASYQDGNTNSSDAESLDENYKKETVVTIKTLRPKKLSVSENCHMLHYVNEIARKDIEIAGLRKAKYSAEMSLRKAIQDKVTAQEELSDKIALLEEQVDRLERCKTREGANLEYLKNVIISYIVSKDVDGKRHMMNAISAVLQFTSSEIQMINNSLQHK